MQKETGQDSAVALALYKERTGEYLHAVATDIYNATVTGDDSTSILRAISRAPLAQDQWRDLVEASILLEHSVVSPGPIKFWVLEVNKDEPSAIASRLQRFCSTAADLVQQTVKEARSISAELENSDQPIADKGASKPKI